MGNMTHVLSLVEERGEKATWKKGKLKHEFKEKQHGPLYTGRKALWAEGTRAKALE